MREAFKNFFTQYSSEKLLALLLTLILWTFAISRNSESRDYLVKVNVIYSKDQIIISEPVDQIQVKLSGNVFDFVKINEKDLVVNLDIAAKKPGKFTRLLDAKMMTFAKDLSVEKIFPSEIIIRTAKKNDVKELKKDKRTQVEKEEK
jgi:YbbR domain-containing protein